MELKEPVKVKESDLYSVVLEDADGVTHYWHLNGDYDGYSTPHTESKGQPEVATGHQS